MKTSNFVFWGDILVIQIVEVKTARQLRAFIKFPHTLYRKNVNWIPPLFLDEHKTLRRDKNPAFDYCEARYWLALEDGRVAGRIAGIVNHLYIKKWHKKNARFGWFDFIEREGVAARLLETVEEWAREKGMEGIQGPMGFCDLDKEGLLVEGFEERGTFTTLYNYPYYQSYLEKMGYKKDVDWVEFEMDLPRELPEKVSRIIPNVRERTGLTVLHFSRRREILPYASGIFELLNKAYIHLYGVVPLTDKQINFYVKQYFDFINPHFVKLVVDKRGEPAAFAIGLPSLGTAMQRARGRLLPFGFYHILRALRRNDAIELMLVAVRPDLQGKGVNTLLMDALFRACHASGIVRTEFNPQLETNHKVLSQWKHFPTRQHKRRRCYIKSL